MVKRIASIAQSATEVVAVAEESAKYGMLWLSVILAVLEGMGGWSKCFPEGIEMSVFKH